MPAACPALMYWCPEVSMHSCVDVLLLRLHPRYLYLPILTKKDAEEHITYRRYKLSDEKNFVNFFHPEKQALMALVDAFSHRRGKFAIQGYPQKLGFLLHGPPGAHWRYLASNAVSGDCYLETHFPAALCNSYKPLNGEIHA
eukprot:GHUV01032721.1.p1 GENE.GHUV01032721.1~~GHUV01032721.1.p1  ORF type:complete len:142 (-),score=24.01 GHUV01032721.1:929-1354(-)